MTNLAIATCAYAGVNIAGALGALLAQDRARRCWRAFARNDVSGWILTAIDLFWAGYLVLNTPPFNAMPRIHLLVYVGAPLMFFLMVVFMEEMLAPRALGGFLLLLATPFLDAARWEESTLRFVITVLAYLWVIAGMWLVISPYRFRQFADYLAGDGSRFRRANLCGLAIGILLLTLGLTVY